jgi:hypothetical protein
MNTNFTPLYPIQQQGLKDKIETISKIALSQGNAELSSKIGAIKGLYAAYEIAPSVQLMEAIATSLAEIIELLLSLTTPVISRTVIKEKDIFDLFREYLLSNGFLKPDGTPTTTVDVYIRALKRFFNNKDENLSDEMVGLIDSLRQAILMSNVDFFNEIRLKRAADLLASIIKIKERSDIEIEKNKKDHGTTLCALKRFLMFILWLLSQCEQVQ